MKIKQYILKKFVDIIYKINKTEIKLEIKKEGIHTILADPAYTELLKIRIPFTACDEYDLRKTGEMDLGIDPEKLRDFLRLYKKDDMVTAYYDAETNRLMLKVGNLVRGMGLIDTDGMPDPKIPEIDFKNKFTINSKIFYDSLKKVSKPKKYQDYTKITVLKNGVNLEEFEEDPDEKTDISTIFLDINIDDVTIQYVNADPNTIFCNDPVLKQLMEYSKSIDYLTVETNGYDNPIHITGSCNFLEVEYWRAQMEPNEEYCKHKTLIEPETEPKIETEPEIKEPLIAELHYGATEIFLYKDTWFYDGDIGHNDKNDIEHNAKILKEIYEKYKDQIEKLVGVKKDYDKNYVYLLSAANKKIEDISYELKVWIIVKINDYYKDSYRFNRWVNFSDLLEVKTEVETEKRFCPECGRELIDNHCPVHLEVIPVDENDPIVKQYKEIEELERKKESDIDRPTEPLIAIKENEKTESKNETEKYDIYSNRLSIRKPKGLPYDKFQWTSDMEKYKDKIYKKSEQKSKKALLKVIDKQGFVFFIVHSNTNNVNSDKNTCENIINELLPRNFVLIAWYQINFENWIAQTVKKA
jgi:hypothetical protein